MSAVIIPTTDDQLTFEAWLYHKARAAGAPPQVLPADYTDIPTLLPWSLTNRRIDDQPYSLHRFRPLQALYEDPHDRICVMKPAQVGVSEWAICYVMWALLEGYKQWAAGLGVRKDGINVGYCFPTASALKDFVKERFAGLEHETEYLTEVFKRAEYDDVHLKKFGNSFLYLRGAWAEAGLLSFPADLLVLDEYDRMDRGSVELARKRLRQSLFKRQLCLSTPTAPEVGIHELYLQSDQRIWEVHCLKCGSYNELDYFRDVYADGSTWNDWKLWEAHELTSAHWTTHCPTCKEEVDRCGAGRWRPQEPGRRWHGYKIPALAFPSVVLEDEALLAVSEDPDVITEFFRSVLGIPYAPADSRLTEADLFALSEQLEGGLLPELLPPDHWRRVTMGVDVGARFHYRIDGTHPNGQRYILAAGAVRKYADLTELMNRHKVRACVIDAQPELHATQEWAQTFKGRVWRAFYPTQSALAGKLFALGSSIEQKTQTKQQKTHRSYLKDRKTEAVNTDIVQINRTMAMDAVYAQIIGVKVFAPAELTHDKEFRQHLCAPVRVRTKDEEGQEHATWAHSKPDHLYHASVYVLIAEQVIPREPMLGVFSQRTASGGWSKAK